VKLEEIMAKRERKTISVEDMAWLDGLPERGGAWGDGLRSMTTASASAVAEKAAFIEAAEAEIERKRADIVAARKHIRDLENAHEDQMKRAQRHVSKLFPPSAGDAEGAAE
jgi:hypothetical protein